jgi:hypothetical protein
MMLQARGYRVADGSAKALTDTQIDALMKAEAPNGEWEVTANASEYKMWKTKDGELIATHIKSHNSLSITTKDAVARRASRREQGVK